MKIIGNITRFSRPANSGRPFQFLHRRVQIVGKEVHLGNHAATDHFAPAAGTFIPAQDLYDNRKRHARPRG